MESLYQILFLLCIAEVDLINSSVYVKIDIKLLFNLRLLRVEWNVVTAQLVLVFSV